MFKKCSSLPSISAAYIQRHRSGFTLTEIGIVLLVIGAILGGLWSVIANMYEKSRLTAAINEVNLISQNMTSLLQGGYGANGAVAANTNITADMIAAKVIPTNYTSTISPTTRASHPWQIGRTDPANPTSQGTGMVMWWLQTNPAVYEISFYNVSEDGCVGLLMALTACTGGQPGCPYNVETDLVGYSFGTIAGQMTTAQAQTMCDLNNYTGGGPNSVEFRFLQ